MQLLHKLSIRSVNGPEKLLKVVKNPITIHLPTNAYKISKSYVKDIQWKCLTTFRSKPDYCIYKYIAMSGDAQTVKLSEYVKTNLPTNQSIVIFIGAMASGPDEFEQGGHSDSYITMDAKISISDYPLSAAVTCSKVTNAFEELWGVL